MPILILFLLAILSSPFMIENSKDLLEKGTIISSPANNNIVYKLRTAFEIIVAHEQRHFVQSKEAFEMMKNKASS